MRGFKKILLVSLQLALILQVCGVGVFWHPQKAGAQSHDINDNSWCGVSLTDVGAVYTLSANITCASGAGLTINANSITIDGSHHYLTGPGTATYVGITINSGKTGAVIENFDSGNGISNFKRGIMAWGPNTNAQITHNTFNGNANGIYSYGNSGATINYNAFGSNTSVGILLDSSSNNIITNNSIANSGYGVKIWGDGGSASSNNVSNNTFTSNANGGVYLYSSGTNGNTITDNTISGGLMGIYLDTSANSNTFTNNKIESTTDGGIRLKASTDNVFTNTVINNNYRGIYVESSTASTATFNNTTINNSTMFAAQLSNSGDVLTFTNNMITNNNTVFDFGISNGTINTDHSIIQGKRNYPLVYTTGTVGTWNGSAIDGAWHGAVTDINDPFHDYVQTKENTGFFSFSTDDADANIDYFKEAADYAMSNYGIAMTEFVNDTNILSADEISKLQALYNSGHEIGVHTRHHTNLSYTYPMQVTYTGNGTGMSLTVNSDAAQLAVTGSADTFTIDLTSAPNNLLGDATHVGLCRTIDVMANYNCVTRSTTEHIHLINSNSLKTQSTGLTKDVATSVLYDDDSGPNNRFLKEEITNSINDLTAAIGGSYEPKSLAFPGNASSAFVRTWIRNNTGLTSTRSTVSFSQNLSSIDLYDVSGYYSDTDTTADIVKSAAVIASYVSTGKFMGMLNHNESQGLTLVKFKQLIDELQKYRSRGIIEINTFKYFANKIKTSGDWTDGGSGTWTRTFTGSDDFRPASSSSAINAGVAVSGRTTDIAGNPIIGTPDIGAYEFQSPLAPSSLAQYKSNGTTSIGPAAWTNETTVTLKFNMTSINPVDSLTPKIEIQPIGTDFTNNATTSGGGITITNPAVAYLSTGDPVVGVVTVSGLSSGTTYHWQASAGNASGVDSSWVLMGSGSADFGVDTTAPTVALSDNHSDDIVRDADTVTITATFIENEGIDETTKPTITIGNLVTGVEMSKTDNLHWTYPWDVPSGHDGNVAVSITAHDTAGNANTAATGKTSYTIDNIAPIISEHTAVATPTKNTTPEYWYQTDEAGTLAYSGDCSSTTTNALFGIHGITFNTLGEGIHNNCTITVTDTVGNVSNTLAITLFTVDSTAPTLSIFSPTTNSSTTASSINITGTATDAESGISTLTANGVSVSSPANFSITASLNFGLNTLTIIATNNAGNSTTQTLNITRTEEIAPDISSIIRRGDRALAPTSSTITDNNTNLNTVSIIDNNSNTPSNTVLDPNNTTTITTQYPTFSGVTTPNSIVELDIDSGVIRISTTSDANGKWSYTVTEPLGPGLHSVVVTVKDASQKVLDTKTYSFQIADTTQAQGNIAQPASETKTKSFGYWWLIIIGAVVLIGLIFVIKRRKLSKRANM